MLRHRVGGNESQDGFQDVLEVIRSLEKQRTSSEEDPILLRVMLQSAIVSTYRRQKLRRSL